MTFEIRAPGNGSVEIDVLRAIWSQTDGEGWCVRCLECSGSVAIAPSAWKLQMPLMHPKWTVTNWCSFQSNLPKQMKYERKEDQTKKNLVKWSRIERDWWNFVWCVLERNWWIWREKRFWFWELWILLEFVMIKLKYLPLIKLLNHLN